MLIRSETSFRQRSSGSGRMMDYSEIIAGAGELPYEIGTKNEVSCGLHQIAPYIGKLKPSISEYLISKYTRVGDTIADPFCGSGTVPLDAVRLGRSTIAADCSEYALLLTKAKLFPPSTTDEAINRLDIALDESDRIRIDLRSIPIWVRQFFHAETLRQTIALSQVLKTRKEYFLLACLLGILHHQRPGFLSFPSSHLVPYLRTALFPRNVFPELYQYREIRPRMLTKIERIFRRMSTPPGRIAAQHSDVRLANALNVEIWKQVDAIITSPPYMNALDYVRDNRLRLWFLSGCHVYSNSAESTRSRVGFMALMARFVRKAVKRLRIGGHCVMVVGETANRSTRKSHPAHAVLEAASAIPNLTIAEILSDQIPDVRRSRREGRATKREIILVFQRTS